jgi:hypothetical protein
VQYAPSFNNVKKLITYCLVLICSFAKAQFFTSCGKGLNAIVYGTFNDTILDKLVVSGWFTMADGKPYNGIATWDGQKFDSLGKGNLPPIGFRKEPFYQYKGRLYTQANDTRIQTYDYSTKLWSIVSPTMNGLVRDFTIYKNELIIVGDFTKFGNIKVNGLIKFNGLSFDSLPKKVNSYRLNTAEVYKGDLYVGGNFNDSNYDGVAKFDGVNWLPLGTGLVGGSPPEVADLKVYNGKLYIGGMWFNIDGKFNPSCVAWDGTQFISLGTLIYQGGQPAVITNFKVYKNKLYVFGGVDYILNAKNSIDTIRTKSMAVWDGSVWCGVFPQVTSWLLAVENYKDYWYFSGNDIMYGDSIPFTQTSKVDTINYLGKYIGNNGKLERNCFDKIPVKLNSDGIYPNPFTNEVKFNLKSTFVERCNLRIVNSLGQVIKTFVNIDSNGLLNLFDLPQGVYLFTFENDTTRKLFKILKN